MKALCIKPLAILDVGGIVDIEPDGPFLDGHYNPYWTVSSEELLGKTTIRLEMSKLLEYFFVLQVLPETITRQIYEKLISLISESTYSDKTDTAILAEMVMSAVKELLEEGNK